MRSLAVLVLLVTFHSADAELPKIRVEADDWGDAAPRDIEAVCRSAAKGFLKNFPDAKLDPVVISRSKDVPIVLFAKNKAGERRIRLAVQGRHWSQFAYQFGHELCHVLCNYREAKNPNQWFEESLCEAASIYVVRQMSESWKTAPPYPNWKSYAAALDKYGVDHVRLTRGFDGLSPTDWLAKGTKKMDRARCQTVAVHVLLPLLEKEPAHWQAVTALNQFDAAKELTFEQYLADWRSRAPEARRPFIEALARSFDLMLEAK